MTIIAWDGKTLAADRRGTSAGLPVSVKKIHRVGDLLVGISGSAGEAQACLDWIVKGRDPEKYPDCQQGEKRGYLLVVEEGKAYEYERTPYPIPVLEPFTATGDGRDFALAAMHLGCSAKEAVEVACHFNVFCGNGIDTLTLEGP